jgi:hypothetical protein
MLPLDGGSGTQETQTASAPLMSGNLSDTDIAHALVLAIRAVPGVLEMGHGVFAQAATYGPGKRIVGIALGHPTADDLSVEVHVVLDERVLHTALSDVAARSETTPLLLRCSEQVRAVVSHTLEQLGVPVPLMIDVTIDDIR